MEQIKRSAFQQQVVEALLESKAIDLEAVGATFSKFGAKAALEGETLVNLIHRDFFWNCGWPVPEIRILGQRFNQQVSE